jgi:pimeloyl-ACP methyl ester carboxylesterase
MTHVISKDGTRIAYERMGTGPAVVLIDGAMCSRAFGPMPKIAALLKDHFTVYLYDRRGRGESGDTEPYSKAREVEDIDALVRAAGGSAFAVGLSSGAALALEAAASGLPLRKLAVYEPPFVTTDSAQQQPDHLDKLKALVAGGERGAAVKYFMRDMVNVPAPFVLMMQVMRGVWNKLKAVAHTFALRRRDHGELAGARRAARRSSNADARDVRWQDGDASEARRRGARKGAAECSP